MILDNFEHGRTVKVLNSETGYVADGCIVTNYTLNEKAIFVVRFNDNGQICEFRFSKKTGKVYNLSNYKQYKIIK